MIFIKSFLVGGIICAIVQIFIDKTKLTPGRIMVGLVCMGVDVYKRQVKDKGVGIENVEKAKEPLFTTKPELERSGIGFMFMEMCMDDLYVESKLHNGTTVCMTKKIKNNRK